MTSLVSLLLLLISLNSPSRKREPRFQQLYAYVVVSYTTTNYKTYHFVSQVFGYCSSIRSDPFRGLEKQARVEAELLEGQGQIQRPELAREMSVSLNGGSTTRADAERSRMYWVKRAVAEYESGLDAVYYPASVCNW
jgi:hypothetical protein